MSNEHTEPVRISKDTMNKLRKHVAERWGGRVYGKLSETVAKAITEYLAKRELYRKLSGEEIIEGKVVLLEIEFIKICGGENIDKFLKQRRNNAK